MLPHICFPNLAYTGTEQSDIPVKRPWRVVVYSFEKDRTPDDLTAFIGVIPVGFHAVTQHLFWHGAPPSECRFVYAKQSFPAAGRRCLGHHSAAVTQRDGEAAQPTFCSLSDE